MNHFWMKSCQIAMGIMFASSTFATCDLSVFDDPCRLPVLAHPMHHQKKLVYCGNTPVYLTATEYAILSAYQHAEVNMDLMVNDLSIETDCIPADG